MDRKALIFDSDAESCTLLSAVLARLNCDSEVVENGLAAFDSIEEYSPDIIFADVGFKDIGGFDLLDGIKGKKIHTPVIITGGPEPDNILRAFRDGAHDYFLKPYDEKILSRQLEKTIARLENPKDSIEGEAGLLLKKMERSNHELNTLLKITSTFHVAGNSKKKLLTRLTDLAADSMHCEAASILLVNERAKALEFVVATGEKKNRLETLSIPMGEGIAGWVAVHGEDQVVNDTSKDKRFTGKVDKESGFETRQILAVPLKLDDRILGVLEVINTRDNRILNDDDIRMLSSISDRAATVIEASRTIEEQQNYYVQMTNIIVKSIEKKDMYSIGHPWSVAEISHKIAAKMLLSETEKNDLHFGALLHDIGKLDMPCGLFNKRTLSDREMEFIRQHPVKGAKLLEPITVWSGVVPNVLYHHEAWDGSGYPFGKSGDSVPIGARIINLAESFTVMRSPNSYKKRMSIKETILEIMRLSGRQFDPDIVKIFVSVLEKDFTIM